MSLSQILICCHLDYQYLKLFYGNQTIEFFSCDPFLLDEYISLMANLCLNQIWDTIHEYSGIVISGWHKLSFFLCIVIFTLKWNMTNSALCLHHQLFNLISCHLLIDILKSINHFSIVILASSVGRSQGPLAHTSCIIHVMNFSWPSEILMQMYCKCCAYHNTMIRFLLLNSLTTGETEVRICEWYKLLVWGLYDT